MLVLSHSLHRYLWSSTQIHQHRRSLVTCSFYRELAVIARTLDLSEDETWLLGRLKPGWYRSYIDDHPACIRNAASQCH